MTWTVGPIDLERNPEKVSKKASQALKSVTILGQNPFLYSLGSKPAVVSFEVWLSDNNAISLAEIERNTDIQPIRLTGADEYDGFYYVSGVNEVTKAGFVGYKFMKVELYLYGGLGSYIQGSKITSLSSVTNDWGI